MPGKSTLLALCAGAALLTLDAGPANACTATDIPGLKACVAQLIAELAQAREALPLAWADGAATSCSKVVVHEGAVQRTIAARRRDDSGQTAACDIELAPRYALDMPGSTSASLLVAPELWQQGMPGSMLRLPDGRTLLLPQGTSITGGQLNGQLASRPSIPNWQVMPSPY